MARRKAMKLSLEPERDRRRAVRLNGHPTSWRLRRGRDDKGRRSWELVLLLPDEPPREGKVWCRSPEARAVLAWLRKVLRSVEERKARLPREAAP